MKNKTLNYPRPVSVTVETGKLIVDAESGWHDRETEQRPATFHTWSKSYHCPAGDGSMIQETTIAVIEMEDGSIQYCEPRKLRFTDTFSVKEGE